MSDKKETTASHHILVAYGNNGDATLSIKDLTLNIPDTGRVLVEPFSLSLKKGDRLFLTGASGAGKSTIVRAIVPDVWEGGHGEIRLPEDFKLMVVSQKSFITDRPLSGVLCSPEADGFFNDRQMEDALRAAGHGRLVQYLPGRQVRHVMDELLTHIPELGLQHGKRPSESDIAAATEKLTALLPELVANNVDIIDCVAVREKEYLHDQLSRKFDEHVGVAVPDMHIKHLEKAILQSLDEQLSKRLMNALQADFPQLAAESRLGSKNHVDAKQVRLYQKHLHKALNEGIEKHMGIKRGFWSKTPKGDAAENEHKLRLAWNLATRQTEAVVKNFAPRQTENYVAKHGLFNRIAKVHAWFEQALGACDRKLDGYKLNYAFKAAQKATQLGGRLASFLLDEAVLALRAPHIIGRAKETAKYLQKKTNTALDRQVVSGDILSHTLSGGEQQRLVFARIFLHSPDIVILDEVSSALDETAAEDLYKLLIDKMPDTTIISIAHNKNIMKFHTLHANLENRKITVQPIAPRP